MSNRTTVAKTFATATSTLAIALFTIVTGVNSSWAVPSQTSGLKLTAFSSEAVIQSSPSSVTSSSLRLAHDMPGSTGGSTGGQRRSSGGQRGSSGEPSVWTPWGLNPGYGPVLRQIDNTLNAQSPPPNPRKPPTSTYSPYQQPTTYSPFWPEERAR